MEDELTSAKYRIEAMQAPDWPQVREIYLQGIATGNATFETAAPDWPEWDAAHVSACRLVARRAEQVLGWAALSPVSGRPAYAGVAEVSVYVATAAHGQGIGTALLVTLVEESDRRGFWTLQAAIFPENIASVRMHRACGFREVGRRERIGWLHGAWRDTLLLERRSAVVGPAA